MSGNFSYKTAEKGIFCHYLPASATTPPAEDIPGS